MNTIKWALAWLRFWAEEAWDLATMLPGWLLSLVVGFFVWLLNRGRKHGDM